MTGLTESEREASPLTWYTHTVRFSTSDPIQAPPTWTQMRKSSLEAAAMISESLGIKVMHVDEVWVMPDETAQEPQNAAQDGRGGSER